MNTQPRVRAENNDFSNLGISMPRLWHGETRGAAQCTQETQIAVKFCACSAARVPPRMLVAPQGFFGISREPRLYMN